MHQTISSVTPTAVAADAPDRCDTSASLRHHPLTSQVMLDVLLQFLSTLVLHVGRTYDELREDARLLMCVAGLRCDDDAIALGESLVRDWVSEGRRSLSIDGVREELQHLALPGSAPKSVLLVNAIDRDSAVAEAPTMMLDWVDLFDGEEARTRRQLTDASLWNSRLRVEAMEAARNLRDLGCRSVLVRGHMRLPTWFTVGTALGRTVGFDEVAKFQGNSLWSSKGDLQAFPIEELSGGQVSPGGEVAIGLAISAKLDDDVMRYAHAALPDVGRCVILAPKHGVSNMAFRSPAEVRGWALAVRDRVRGIVKEQRATKLHLFLATPAGAALILGHHWDRMPPTQVYEDPGAIGEYSPSFLVPN